MSSSITLKWAGTYLDGAPCTGSLYLAYQGSPFLQDDATNPLSVYPTGVTIPLTTRSISLNGTTQVVGYAEITVPASNDPAIPGSGGTYTLNEFITRGGGRTGASFVADKDTPGGVIWLNKIIPSAPVTGVPASVVHYTDFTTLRDRVTTLEGRPAGTGTAVANTLAIGTVTSGTTPAATITGAAPNQTLNLTLPKGADGTTPDVSGKIDRDATETTDRQSWIRRLTLGYTPATASSDVFQLLIGGVKKLWSNEWGALRGTSPYTWGDALVRAVRSDGDGITAGNFIELNDRRTAAATTLPYGRRWTDGALIRNGITMADTYVTNSSTDPNIAKLPAGTVVVVTP